MPQSNHSFALLTLGQWCRNHGIYEIRDVLANALQLAKDAGSSELLAAALVEAAMAPDGVVSPSPEVPAPIPSDEQDVHPPRKGKRTGLVSIDAATTD